MRKFCLRLLLTAIILQPLLDFAAGQRFEVFLLGYFWQIVDIVTILVIVLFGLTWLLEERALRSVARPKLSVAFRLLFAIVTVIVLAGTVRGIQRGFYSVLGDAETLLTVLVLAVLGWSVHLSASEWKKNIAYLAKGSILIALLSILHAIDAITQGTPTFGYLHYDAYFLMTFGLLAYLTEVPIAKEHTKRHTLIVMLFIAALLLNVNKAILLSLAIALPVLMWVVSRGQSLRTAYLSVRRGQVLVSGIIVAIALFFTTFIFPDSVGAYYRYFVEERVLHRSQLTEFDVESLTGGRTELWDLSLNWFRKEPWLGQGVGFRIITDNSIELGVVNVGFHAHNQYVYMLVALGAPASAIMFFFLSAYFYRMFQGLRRQGLATVSPDFLPYLGFLLVMFAFGVVGLWNISSAGSALLGISLGHTLQLSLQNDQSALSRVLTSAHHHGLAMASSRR